MCGINGLVSLEHGGSLGIAEELERTSLAMASRGPDGNGVWLDTQGEVGLAHRRLAIIDLSEGGAQPMTSADGRFVLVFNGAIYNHDEIRSSLEIDGRVFRSTSDTEVLLELWQKEGAECLSKLRGMYALGVWDTREHRLTLARDPYGIKPLYYSQDGSVLRFASQVKALEAGGGVSREPDPAAAVAFLQWGWVPEPLTIRRAVHALPAGSRLEIAGGKISGPMPFGCTFGAAGRGGEEPPLDPIEALRDSVRCHLVSDVPVAVFLSAGIDSALIASLASAETSAPLVSLTLRFEEFLGSKIDEAPLARQIAEAFGTKHIEHTVTRADWGEIQTDFFAAMDQPSMDGLNTFLVSRAAEREGIKVVLSGLGGDELFGSYPAFKDVPRWHRAARATSWLPGLEPSFRHLSQRLFPRHPKLPELLRASKTLPGAYGLRRGLFQRADLETLLGRELAQRGIEALGALDPATQALEESRFEESSSPWLAVHLMESLAYMRNQLLRDSDWASMAHGLELRVPLVDTVLRRHMEQNHFEPARSRGKAEILRRAASKVPPAVLTRPKSGFVTPAAQWLNLESPSGSWGGESRAVAMRVLPRFGVEVRSSKARS